MYELFDLHNFFYVYKHIFLIYTIVFLTFNLQRNINHTTSKDYLVFLNIFSH